MKIQIDIELAQHEVPLAQELLNTLRVLTEHVKGEPLRVKISDAPAAAAPIGAAAAAQPAQAPPTPVPVPVPVPTPAAPPALSREQRAVQLMAQLENPAALPQVVGELYNIFQAAGDSLETAMDEVFAAFEAVAFNAANLAKGQTVEQYMAVLPALPEPFRSRFKDKFIKGVLAHLNKKRAGVPPSREELYPYCEAFSILISMGITQMDGALQMMTRLVKRPEQKYAALVMLTHVLQRNHDKLSSCKPEHVASLCSLLAGITEESYAQELAFIKDMINKHAPGLPAAVPQPQPLPQPATPAPPPTTALSDGPALAPASGPASTLVLTRSFGAGATGSIFALSYDAGSGCVVAGGKDMDMGVWRPDGTQAHRIRHPGVYVCGADINPHHGLLAWCGMADTPGATQKTRLALHNTKNSYQACGEVVRSDVEMYTCLRFLPEADALVVGETVNSMQEVVAYYDVNRLLQQSSNPAAAGPVTPLHTFTGHQGLVTCLSALPGRGSMFATGSRDQTVRLWDARQKDAASTLLVTHANMVTGIDCVGNLLVTCSLDKSVVAWDLRVVRGNSPTHTNTPLAAGHWENGGALKVASYGSPSSNLVAVATVAGLVALDFSRSMAPPAAGALVLHALSGNGQPLASYNDIKWDTRSQMLYAAASDAPRVDVLAVRPIQQ